MNLELFRKNVGRYEKKCTTLKMLIIGLTFLTAIVSILMKLDIEQSRHELKKHGGVLRKLLHGSQMTV